MALHVASLLMGQGSLQLINQGSQDPASCNSFFQRTLNRILGRMEHKRAFQGLLVNELFCSRQKRAMRNYQEVLFFGSGQIGMLQSLRTGMGSDRLAGGTGTFRCHNDHRWLYS